MSEEKNNSGLNFMRLSTIAILLLFLKTSLFAQEDPPVPITITPIISSVSFGSLFDPGNDGGSVTINPQTGTRVPSGVVMFGSTFARGEYNITGGNAGTLISLTFTEDIVLDRVGGGSTIDMHIELFPSPWFVLEAAPVENKLYIGGTLTIGPSVLSGTYNSSIFTITLNRE